MYIIAELSLTVNQVLHFDYWLFLTNNRNKKTIRLYTDLEQSAGGEDKIEKSQNRARFWLFGTRLCPHITSLSWLLIPPLFFPE